MRVDKKFTNWLPYLLLTIVGFALSFSAYASVVLGSTRVVFNASDSEVTLTLDNVGKLPGLIQIWLDNGEQDTSPENIDVPFLVTPSLVRIDPSKGQTLRILKLGNNLPKDKESVFWINVLEIPAQTAVEKGNINQVNIAFRSRIKLFYRPSGLPGRADETPAKIVWHLEQQDGKTTLIATNPTAYHFSFSSIDVINSQRKLVYEHGGMVPPSESLRLTLDKKIVYDAQTKVIYRAINDYGGQQVGETPVTRP